MTPNSVRLDPAGHPAHDRAVDKDTWAKLTAAIERYKVLWLVAFALGGWFGNRITQPLSAVPILQAEQKAFRAEVTAKLDTADRDRKEMSQVLKVFGKIICAQMSADDRYKYGIRCREIPTPEIRP